MLELENNSHAAACPEVSRPTEAPPRVDTGVPTEAHVLKHFKFEEADIDYSTESLLSALPPNYISAFEVVFFPLSPPTSVLLVCGQASTDCLTVALTEWG